MYIIAKTINTSDKEAVIVVVEELNKPRLKIDTIRQKIVDSYSEIDDDFEIEIISRFHVSHDQSVNRILTAAINEYSKRFNNFKYDPEQYIVGKLHDTNMAIVNKASLIRLNFKYYSPDDASGNMPRSLSNSLLASFIMDQDDIIVPFTENDIVRAQEIFTHVYPLMNWMGSHRTFLHTSFDPGVNLAKLTLCTPNDDLQVFDINKQGVDQALKTIKVITNNGEDFNDIILGIGA